MADQEPKVWTGPMADERQILHTRLVGQVKWGWDKVSRVQPDPEHAEHFAQLAVVAVQRALRVMSARQLAVWLANEPNTGSGYLIKEPPAYHQSEIEAAL